MGSTLLIMAYNLIVIIPPQLGLMMLVATLARWQIGRLTGGFRQWIHSGAWLYDAAFLLCALGGWGIVGMGAQMLSQWSKQILICAPPNLPITMLRVTIPIDDLYSTSFIFFAWFVVGIPNWILQELYQWRYARDRSVKMGELLLIWLAPALVYIVYLGMRVYAVMSEVLVLRYRLCGAP